MTLIIIYVLLAVVISLGAALSYFLFLSMRQRLAEQKIRIAEETAKRVLEDAKKEAETKRREALLEAKDQALKMRAEFDRETRERKGEILSLEKRLMLREETIDKKERSLEDLNEKLKVGEAALQKTKEVLEQKRVEIVKELEKVSAMTQDDAKRLLLKTLQKDIERDAAVIIKRKEEEMLKEADKRAKEILTTAIQRCAVDHVVETTTSVVELPSDEMKGRIIGREGRNIRAFETLTGVDLIVDDTPEAVILSGFNPLRRETAKLTLQKLIADGRIHPARVEEMFEKSKEELKNAMWEAGERAALEADVHGLPAVLIQLLGRLKYRTSYGQNVLQHSIEVSNVAGMLAAELGVNVKLAKRAGLLHDIGKAIDQETEGTHTKLGAAFAAKAGETEEVVHGIEAHHEDVPARTIEAILVLVADAISASRPGARRDTLEAYVKRLEKLESVAKSFEGVEKCYAIQAGREVRVIVKPDKIDDIMASKLAHDIAKKIETELEYPGEVRVTVIRETRAFEVAK
ncbi:MAG: ribonuclease Y [Candidatus Saganbacteria bacterium]|nr:ribonuclease Y [Candidatus Saganbacteria bacterium]